MHVVNTTSPILIEVMDQKVALLFCGLWLIFWWVGRVPGRLILLPLHDATCKDDGFVVHMHGRKGFAIQFCDPVTEIIVTCCD